MITARLQHWLDTLRATSPHRWALGAVAVLAVVAAIAVSLVGSGRSFGWFGLTIVVTAFVATIQAGSHTGFAVIALVALFWLGTVDDVTSPRSMIVATCLFVFHTALALMAVTPHSSSIHPDVLRRWLARSTPVVVATVVVWVLVGVFDRRDAEADPALTLLALLCVGASALVLARRSIDGTGR